GDRAVEVEIAGEVRGGRRRKGRIDVNTVAGRIVMLLRDVHLRTCSRHHNAQAGKGNWENGNKTPHTSATGLLPDSFYKSSPVLCQGLTPARPWQKICQFLESAGDSSRQSKGVRPSVAGIGDPGGSSGVVIWETGIKDAGYNDVALLLTALGDPLASDVTALPE